MSDYGGELRGRLVQVLHDRLRRLAYAERKHVLNTLRGFDDPRKAGRYLGKLFGLLLAGPAVSLAQGLMDGVEEKIPGSEIALTAMLSPELRLTWPSGLSPQLQALARIEGLFDLAAIMMEMPTVDERFDLPRRRLPKDLKDIPLGRRKSMARGNDIILMGKLLSDPDGAVIMNLLDNPRLTTQEVVGLAAQKEISGEFLEMIALHPRWGTNYRVRIAIVHNPATPLNIAIAFLHLLMTPELGAVGTDTRLNGIVQKRAAEILRRRRGSGTVRSSASSLP
jgi:hypothetical protein